MMHAVSPPLRRALALTLLALVLATGWSAIIEPLLAEWQRQDMEAAQSSRLLAGYRRLAARRAELEREWQAAQEAVPARQGLMEGGDATLLAAMLQSRIKQIVEGNGGQVRSMQILPQARESDFEKVGIQMDFAIASGGLAAALHEIETARPYLFIEALSLRAPDAPLSGAPAEQQLSVRWNVHGYAKASAP